MAERKYRFRLAVLTVASLLAASCGSTEQVGVPQSAPSSSTSTPPSTSSSASTPTSTSSGLGVVPVAVAVADRSDSSTDPALAGASVTAFGFDLFNAARREAFDANLTVSPASVATALAMLEPGTVDLAQEQLRSLLRIADPAEFHSAMNSLEMDLESRIPDVLGDGDPGEVTVRIANAAYLQEGYPFNPAYLEAIGSDYGPVLHEVDFEPDPDAVAHEINRFVAEATNDRITDLIADGVIDPTTVLALVNALYLKASWLEPFDKADTTADTFTTSNGTEVGIEMMQGFGSSSSQGDGWVGATKGYSGRLYAQFILPDDGRFDEIAGNFAAVVGEYEANQTTAAELGLPKFETRASIELSQTLQSLGLTAPYESSGLLGIADDPRLIVDKVIHETFVVMDEQGSEAAAATVVLSRLTSGPPAPPVPVILDRPFLYRIVDAMSGATLFIGQVADPAAD